MARPRLDELVQRIRTHAGLDATFGGQIDPAAGSYVIDTLAGDGMQALHGITVEAGQGLGGKALVVARPVSVCDYTAAGGITHHYDQAVSATGLRSVFAVPVTVDGRLRAMVYGALRSPVQVSDRRLAAVHRLLKAYEFELRVEDQVARTLDELDAEASVARMREELRSVYAEARAIADGITDPALRARVEALADRVHAGATPAPERGDLRLSPRELDVVTQVAAGHANAEVGARLDLEPSTVKAYLRSAMRKAGVRNRIALVTECRRAGLLP